MPSTWSEREAVAAESPDEAPWRPTGELVQAFECLPESLTFLTVGDHRDSPWPDLIAQLPGTVQMLSSMLGDAGDADSPVAANLLGALGIPRPGGSGSGSPHRRSPRRNNCGLTSSRACWPRQSTTGDFA